MISGSKIVVQVTPLDSNGNIAKFDPSVPAPTWNPVDVSFGTITPHTDNALQADVSLIPIGTDPISVTVDFPTGPITISLPIPVTAGPATTFRLDIIG